MVTVLTVETTKKIVRYIKEIFIFVFSLIKLKLTKEMKYGMKIGRITWSLFKRVYCRKCGSYILSEFPGEFLDFDADPMRGGDGIPLCSDCLGTGIMIDSQRFRELGEKVKRIRRNSLIFQIKLIGLIKEKKLSPQVRNRILNRLYNKRLKEIAREGLKLVKKPRKNCLALELTEDEKEQY